MQMQSATDPPNKIAAGERAIMSDGTEYNVLLLKASGAPVDVIYPTEGTPLVIGPSGVMKNAPNPNAARLFQSYLFSAEGQQLLCDYAAQHSAHPQVKPKPGRPALKDIKVMKDDPVAVEAQAEQIKTRYLSYFKV